MKKQLGVFFDLGWTLCAPASGDWFFTELMHEMVPERVLKATDPILLHKALGQAGQFLEKNHHLTTLAAEEAQFTQYYAMIAAHFPEWKLTDEMCAQLSHSRVYDVKRNYVLLPGALETVQTLKKRGWKVGVISDTWPSVTSQLTYYGMDGLFDSLTFSFELGVFKPAKSMYQDALGKLGLPPEDTCFVDDQARNLDGAAEAGIPGVQSIAEPGTRADGRYPAIKKPPELLRLLGVD